MIQNLSHYLLQRKRWLFMLKLHEIQLMAAPALGPIDLNLIKIFNAVYEDRNLLRAGKRLNLAEQIDVGRIDLAMGVFQKIPEHFRSFALMTEGDLVIMHSSHPAAGPKLTLQDMVTYPLLTISVGGKEEGAVDGFILERGLARQSEMFDRNALQEALATIGAVPRYRITIAHSMVIASVMERTEMLSILPCSLARLFVATDDLLMVLPPYPVSHSTFRGIWHNRNDHDPAHLWFRKIVQRAVELMPKGVPS
ncbi:LysR substrate-binding domain-containing protein [Pseudooceanicola spongiae]|uniref:LysR substrate-binding domain-containing protein n=1 Tax=Pseudooceanicola spongiae TaxID=2613965 RepID=UPI001866123B|nr:LysR substrate-binding domain-containing protein [Pseudooceanicola spongiae]